MAGDDPNSRPEPTTKEPPRAFRSIEAVAIAGLVYSVLIVTGGIILSRTPAASAGEAELARWYAEGSNQRSVLTALNLIAVAVLAFMWFVAVIRRRAADRENKFFGTVFLGSALLVSGVWLMGAMLLAAPAVAVYLSEVQPEVSDVAVTRSGASIMLVVVASRLEAAFVLSTTTVARLSKALPIWLIILGYVLGLLLMFAIFPQPWLRWPFPVWVAVVSATLLVTKPALVAEPPS